MDTPIFNNNAGKMGCLSLFRFSKGLVAGLSIFICLSLTGETVNAADTLMRPRALESRFENDSFGGTDRYYTNGISLALTTPGTGPLSRVAGLFEPSPRQQFTTFELTQLLFTPADIQRTNPDPNDRPYAGVLYLGLASHLQREDSLHSLKLLAGVVGPASLSEGVQAATHSVLSNTLPKGWGYQIRNEVICNLLYEWRHRFSLTPPDSAIGVQIIPLGGVSLGNYLTQGELSLQTRFGYQLPADFGTTLLRGMGYLPFPEPGEERHNWGVYAFAGGSAKAVGRNITLDGNTFVNSRSVHKRVFLPTAEFGAVIWTHRFQTSFSYVMMGKEFSGQLQREKYGSILVSLFY